VRWGIRLGQLNAVERIERVDAKRLEMAQVQGDYYQFP
jgi:hypothetical protein